MAVRVEEKQRKSGRRWSGDGEITDCSCGTSEQPVDSARGS